MKILLAHNYYQLAGGEDQVVASESELLNSKGQQLKLFSADNRDIQSAKTLKIAWQATYSQSAKLNIATEIEGFKPDIVHVHNFFPVLTPSIYDACQELGAPVVQTLHNYRIICPGALLMHSGKVCEQCVKGSAYQAVLYGCYRNSRLGSLAVARMIEYHRKRRTWQKKVGRFVALTDFAKEKFVAAGLPAEKISVKPNFYNDEGGGARDKGKREGALFVGRLSNEKGIMTLLEAWQKINISLRIAGDGPLMNKAHQRETGKITLLGSITSEKISREMASSHFLIMPSEWYETFGLVIIEAFAHGLPVIASRLGAMAEIVEDGVTGLHFEAGNSDDLVEKVNWMNEHPEECRRMGENARKVYEEKYTPERNYEMLMDIYQQAIDENRVRSEE